jgi:hypothetical protein
VFRAVLAVFFGLAAIVAARPEATSAPAAALAPKPQLSQLLGFANGRLVHIDPESLQPLPGKSIRTGSGGCAPRLGGIACWSNPTWTVSPDEQRLVIARNAASSLQVVDARRMSVTGSVRVGGGTIGALAWLEPGRVIAVQEIEGKERQRVLGVDLVNRRVTARRALGGSVQSIARTANELVLLLAPAGSIGPARLALADGRGAVRFVRLDRILAGAKLLGTGSEHSVDSRTPGLAVDPRSRRAFVVDDRVTAEIDLNSLAVSYHDLDSPSILSRLWNWLEPAAAAKQTRGYAREARWLGGNLLAISGSDTDESRTRAAGLLVIDTSNWSVHVIDAGATSFQVAGDVLLAIGGGWDAATERATGIGFAAYAFDGARRFRLFDGELTWMTQSYGGRAYVGISGQQTLRVVDLRTGSIVATREEPLPWLLLGEGAGWWN